MRRWMGLNVPDAREWLIRKGGYFYREKWCGYTTDKFAAGRYTRAEAEAEASKEPSNMKAIHEDEVPDGPADIMRRNHRDLLAAARELMDAVNYDMSGINGQGGNGGLISTTTVRRSDELRQVILRLEAPHE